MVTCEVQARAFMERLKVTCCAFGGNDLSTLFITTSRYAESERDLAGRGSSVLGAVTQAASGRVADLSSRKLSRRCSAARSASADTVGVGFTTPPVANELPSTMNRLGTSQAWCQRLTTEDSGDAPIRQVPRRCQAGVR